jgi:hypothetical protein
MIKQHVSLEVKVKEKPFSLIFPQDSSLGECFDALTEMRHYIVNRIKEVEQEEREEGMRLAVGENQHSYDRG